VHVLALHVHHGLSAHADEWLRHGADLCRRWARRGLPVQFVAHVLGQQPARGDSVEAWARRARYRALRRMALDHGADLVLLAHHRRDQAETFLLQALRGGGVAGLAAMPGIIRREGVTWGRPWLGQPREAIEAYARRQRLRYIDDASNDDPRFDRNRLRLRVWPVLDEAFPGAEAALASAARWAQEAAAGLDAWAAVDLPSVTNGDELGIAAWRALPSARQVNALRAWLHRQFGKAAPASLVTRLLAELDVKASMRWPAPPGELRSYRGRLRCEARTPQAQAAASVPADLSEPGKHPFAGWGGSFVVEAAASNGLAVTMAGRLELRPRRGGDRFQAGPGRPPRSLKLQYQAAGVPAWQRAGPIVCHEGVPVFVPGLGLDARARALDGEPQVRLEWRFG
jgi:tRNA(Ile)-lysidine synthase